MPLTSKFPGKCKDCGKEFAIGEMIGKNSNDHWCKDETNCQGAMALGNKPTASYSKPVTRKAEDLRKKILAENPDNDVLHRHIQEAEKSGKQVICHYIGVLEACESMGITDPPVIGMIFNKTMDIMKC